MRSSRYRSAALACCLAVLTGFAAPALAEGTDEVGESAAVEGKGEPEPPLQALSASSIKTGRLDNGLRIVMHVDQSLPQVAVCATYDAGTRHDPREQPGLAAVVHRMLREGGRSTRGSEYSRKVEARGGQLENQLNADYARFCTLVPKHELELALWLESGRFTSFAFNQPNFERRVEELRSEYLDSVEGSVYARGLRRLNEIAFQDAEQVVVSPPDPLELERLLLKDASDFHQQHYHAGNVVLSLVGDFDAFSALDLAKRHLARARAGERRDAPAVGLLPTQTSPRFSVLIDPSARTAAAYYGWITPPSAAARVLNTLLAQGEDSLLNEDLISQQRLASTLTGWTAPRLGQALFALHIQTSSTGRLDAVEKRINAVLARVARGGPLPAATVQGAKRRTLRAILERSSSNLGKAQILGERALAGKPPAFASEVDEVDGVTAEQLREVARDQLVLARRTSVEVYPKEWRDPNQAAMPTFHVVSSGENLTRIAQRYGTSAAAVAKMNGIDAKRPIFPGQKLRVPRGKARNTKGGSKHRSAKKKEAIAYTVKKGDSLSTIAARHDISVAALLRANPLDPKKPLQIGQRLAIPVP